MRNQSVAIGPVLLFIAICFIGVVSTGFLNARRRKRAGPIHPPFDASEILFSENRVSGHSDRDWFTKLGGAHNALAITVLKEAVIIEKFGLLKSMMPQGANDLEHYVRKSDVLSVEYGSSFGRKTIELRFKANDNSTRTISLESRNTEALMAALKA